METSSPPSIDTTASSASRPTIIAVLCVIGFMGGLFTIPKVLSDAARNIGAWYPPYLAFCLFGGLVCVVGLWKMRRWAVFTYSGFVALNQIVLLAMGVWSIFALVIPAIFIFIMSSQLSKMR